MDGSGSTAVLVLITTQFIAVANVGDSRAVLALRPVDQTSTNGRVPSSPRSSFTEGGARDSASSRLLEAAGLSRDHKASIPEEKERIESAGAIIELVGEPAEGREPVYQIYTPASDIKLRMTRSFGDFYLKQNKEVPYCQQAVVAIPEVKVHARSSRDAFIVLACDGIWDVMTNQDAVDFIAERLGFTSYGGPVGGVTTQSAAAACDTLLQACLERGTVDNISVVLVALGAPTGLYEARSTPVFSAPPSANLIDAFTSATPPTSTPAARAATTSSRSAQGSHAPASHGRHDTGAQGALAASDDSEIDIPIFDLKRPYSGSLNEVFATVEETAERVVPGGASPLNTAASSVRVKKQLIFLDS